MNRVRAAVVLLSGGLDSAVALALCRQQGFTPYALTFDYGQRHRLELEAAHQIASSLQVARHLVIKVDLTQWGGSSLTSDIPVPQNRPLSGMGDDIPPTYVPARNTIFLSLAMGWAETLGTGDIFIGAHALDYSGYPDCRPEYFDAFTKMAALATKSGVEGQSPWTIHTPLLHLSKTEIVRTGNQLHVPFEFTLSCYQPRGSTLADWAACGVCDSCLLRRRAFTDLGLTDPIRYRPASGVAQ